MIGGVRIFDKDGETVADVDARVPVIIRMSGFRNRIDQFQFPTIACCRQPPLRAVR